MLTRKLMLRKKRFKARIKGRNNSGWQMVELLIALVIAGFVSSQVMKGSSQLLCSTTAVHNQITACDIAQQVMDNARNQTYDQLLAEVGAHTLTVNNKTGATIDSVFPRALLQDQMNLTYQTATKNGRFRGDATDGGVVTATIINNNNGTARVNVQVTWSDPGGKRRVYNASTLISQKGIHN